MKRIGRFCRLTAAILTAGIIFSTQGLTAIAGTTGIGSARSEQTGPGVAGQTGGQNQAGQTGGQNQAGQAEGQATAGQTEGQATAGQTEGQATAGQTEGQATAGQTEGQGQAGQVEGQAQAGQEQAPPAQPENPLQVNYSAFIVQQGWSAATADNHPCAAGAGSWVTAMRANLINIPQGAQVGIRYQVNLSGSGWLSWSEDGAEAGGAESVMPLESIRMELTGSAASDYDLYYRVLQNGSWTDWAANGSASGVEGAGLRVDGIRASITAKGAGLPAEPVLTPGISSSIDPSRPMIALTFDDGPKTSVTSRILDSLEANGGRATFFMVGSNVNANAGVIKRMVAQGSEVANHTHDHKYISKLNAEGIISQIGSTNQKIEAICGVSPVLMRPPGGYIDARSLSVVGNMGMSAIMWSIDTRDWQHRNAQRTIDTVLSQVRDGDIILMHDIYSTTADAAVVLIPELTARGYQLVTVSELAAYRGGAAPGHKYSQFR
ncbi:polysaccharide deacetylase family protein [Enterocloster sp. OA13]|uniref:polysaccharide deacetylase family protein n=1 Tax=Enterocloster sp. OA13 TaxID=2914161 RepID=UPI001F056853|nr:polysaccharide deacetylase family protein [Enterocloster sp. OA13]